MVMVIIKCGLGVLYRQLHCHGRCRCLGVTNMPLYLELLLGDGRDICSYWLVKKGWVIPPHTIFLEPYAFFLSFTLFSCMYVHKHCIFCIDVPCLSGQNGVSHELHRPACAARPHGEVRGQGCVPVHPVPSPAVEDCPQGVHDLWYGTAHESRVRLRNGAAGCVSCLQG